MAIHHQIKKQAERYGFTLEESGELVRAFMPSRGVQIFGVSGKDAFNQALSYHNIAERDSDMVFEPLTVGSTVGWLRNANNGHRTEQVMTPTELYRSWGELTWTANEPDPEQDEPVDTVERSEKGVPLNGGIAHKEGIMAGDNPFEEGTEEGDQWDEEWDEAAEAVPDEEDVEKSVVSEKYRAIYKERGHPTHCGDDLAVLLNNLCLTKENTDISRFEAICDANGVSLAKYDRTRNGWQGRLRMTGRNLLARKVWANDGVLNMPADWEQPYYQMSQEWLSTRPFKKG